MELIIDIPEEEYKRMKEQSMFGRVDIWKQAIKNGIPLDFMFVFTNYCEHCKYYMPFKESEDT